MKSFTALAAVLSGSNAFLLMNQQVAYERADPIVQPGIVSGHIHNVIGASTFGVGFTPAVWSKAKCSTMQVQENKSNYWMPSVMAEHANGTFSAVPLKESRVYYLNNHAPGTKLKAFPQGLRMVAGNPFATTETPNEPYHDGGFLMYQCQNGVNDGLEYFLPRFPPFACKDFLRLTVSFQDCWNGVDLDSPDHKSHVTYRFTNGTCPSTHPVPMMQIDLELGYRTVGYKPEQLLLSTGDRVGYGLHADYLSFWDVDLLQAALDDPTCQHRENIFGDAAQCNTLVPHRNDAAMESCKLEAAIPQEDTGIAAPIPALPGCNPPWNSTKGETKKGCVVSPPVPNLGPPSEFVNFHWQGPSQTPRVDIAIYKGFNPAPTPSTSSAAATSTSTKPATTLTTIKITTTSKSTTTTKASTSSTFAPAPTPTWPTLGCYTDLVSSNIRALPIAGQVAGAMTVNGCLAACNKQGYTYAGLEYAIECWCGNTIGGGNSKAKEADCNMACAGEKGQTCGSGGRINVYAKSLPTSSTMLYVCSQTNWSGSCKNLEVKHSSVCTSLKGSTYYKNIRSAGPDRGSCVLYTGDNCDSTSVTYGPMQNPGVATFADKNGVWGSVRCYP